MRRANSSFCTSAMTATSLLMRTIALVFQVYVAGKIGAAGIGLFQLVMSVIPLCHYRGGLRVRLAATRLIAQQTGRGDDAAIRRATGWGAIRICRFFFSAWLPYCCSIIVLAAAAWVGDDRIIPLWVLAFAPLLVAASGAAGGYFHCHAPVGQNVPRSALEQFIRIGRTVWRCCGWGGYGLESACGAPPVCSPGGLFPSWRCCFCCFPPRRGRCRTPMLPSLRITGRFPSAAAARSAPPVPPSTCLFRGASPFGGGLRAAPAAYGARSKACPAHFVVPGSAHRRSRISSFPELSTEAQVQGRLRPTC